MMTDWSLVGTGDVVLGAKDKKPWEVVRKAPDGTTTIRNGDREYTFVPFGRVDVIATAAEVLAAAEAAIKVTMPGSVEIMRQDPETKLWTCPNAFPDAGVLQSHAYVLHGKRLEESPLPDMMAEHLRWHEANDVATPHIHTKDWYSK